MRFSPLSWLASALIVGQALAVTPLIVDGALESVVATDGTLFNTGGTITVNGYTIIVPKNMLVQYPATFVTFKQFAAANPAGLEIEVQGNILDDGKAYAGAISVSQFFLSSGQGLVESVSTDGSGTMKIAGGPTLRINTPNGVFGPAYTADPFFTADEENPSISSFSGSPMCIPRSSTDTACPLNNRPANGVRSGPVPTPLTMVPFVKGDFVTFAGIRKNGEYICFSIVAENLQVLTTGDLTYIRVEDTLIGVNTNNPNAEVADSRYIGFTSNSAASISVAAIEQNPCTGEEVERPVTSGSIIAGSVRNKFVFRLTDTAKTKSTREYKFRASTGIKLTDQKLEGGQWTQPVTEVVWPEINVPGVPWPENAFEIFYPLVNGYVFDNAQYQQLDPWPGATAPPKFGTVCKASDLLPPPPPPPVANAGPPVASAGTPIVGPPGIAVKLTGTNTNALLDNSLLGFAWRQTSGLTTGFTLNDANSAIASFNSPAQTTAIVVREFTVKVFLLATPSSFSEAVVKVTTDKAQKDVVTITSFQYTNSGGGTVTVNAQSNVLLTGTNGAQLKVLLAPATVAVAMTDLGGGQFTFSQRNSKNQPTKITVSSFFGASVSTTALVKKRNLMRIEAR